MLHYYEDGSADDEFNAVSDEILDKFGLLIDIVYDQPLFSEKIAIGEVLEGDGKITLALEGVYRVDDKLENQCVIHVVPEGYTSVVAEFTMTNVTAEEFGVGMATDYFTVKAVVDGQYSYDAEIEIESKYGATTSSAVMGIEPLAGRRTYAVVDIPENASGMPTAVYITYNGIEYIYTL